MVEGIVTLLFLLLCSSTRNDLNDS